MTRAQRLRLSAAGTLIVAVVVAIVWLVVSLVSAGRLAYDGGWILAVIGFALSGVFASRAIVAERAEDVEEFRRILAEYAAQDDGGRRAHD